MESCPSANIPGKEIKINTSIIVIEYRHSEEHIALCHNAQWMGVTVAAVVGLCHVTGGLLVRAPALSVSVVVSLGKTLHLPCLLMVVRGLDGVDCMASSLLSVCPRLLWLQCSLPLSV
ncbi:hypothetical protein GOODEAATRI_012965 [Goodea atripinnis]|uniref:Uncharacterized protein n=1 Tax=Goodea atripinnis TaxID=208336 RepID=A0ABV0PDR4_9TELE